MSKGTYEVKVGLAEMLKGGVIMDVTTFEQAKLLRMPVHVRSWHWNVFRQISAKMAAYLV